ncbi:DMSO/TMAO reductase YedYZ, molybdopterin-dependent catalytic subunit [Nocardioides terrae]|uniref:DMSO/TMAO reductase YedYZ, molybdopterin-dependent catalytic subunit n=1 Tax=Nocardioides terrae TaxID=574651 RepID=A0A1I1I5X3_9ACTN|nr:molybdopterin-dependent oxidoreductase [Nocardioides terrae]SFC31415.1 DMSO/TMAO reductase YedYZ, molybdopterin-dependent catalytic subunit [Nocardioides terrae]
MTSWSDRLILAALGPVAAAVGLAAGHLEAAATTPAASPVLAVGSTVIDRTPTPLKEWAIAHFGTNDKTILVGSVLIVVLLAATGVGFAARRSRVLGAGFLVALAAVAGVAAVRRPAAGLADAVPSVVAAVVAVLVLLGLLALWSPRRAAGAGTASPSRRRVLLGLGVATVGAGTLGQLGRRLISTRGRPEDIALPAPVEPAPAFPAGLDRTVPGITPFRTPSKRFYRVDTRLDVPVLSSSDWRLVIDGDVRRPFTLTFEELLAMPMIERDIALTCVSNSVGGPYTGGARWLGVRLTDVLDRAGVGDRADQVLSTDFAGMTISTPLALATDGRDAMVAVGMNGAPLPRAHGFPARLVIPGLYGFISATKWLTRLTLTTYADRSAYWTDRGWATDGPIKISSRIDTPRPLAQLSSGEVVVGGVAWAQGAGGVQRVEISIDGGAWQPAKLGPSAGEVYWRQWFHRWDAQPGSHTLACRVVDNAGQTQTAVRANPFPDGASGIHTINVTVAT